MEAGLPFWRQVQVYCDRNYEEASAEVRLFLRIRATIVCRPAMERGSEMQPILVLIFDAMLLHSWSELETLYDREYMVVFLVSFKLDEHLPWI